MSELFLKDNWNAGDAYERYVGRWSRQVAPLFLSWLAVPAARKWLDLGCGTGALCGAIVQQCAPASVIGIDRSEGFLETAFRDLGVRVSFHQGDATAIPLDDNVVDVVVSGLMLNFVGDYRAAVREMARVATEGGIIAAYVWDYAERMEFMRYFWDAAAALDRGAIALDEAERFPLCRPDALQELFNNSGLGNTAVMSIEIKTGFRDFDDFWQPFLAGQGPAPTYVTTLSEPQRTRLREHLRESVPTADDGSIQMIARAWGVRGSVA